MRLIPFILLICICALQVLGFPHKSDESLIIDFDNELPSISPHGIIDYITGIIEDTRQKAENLIKEINKSLNDLIGNFENNINKFKWKTFNDIETIVKSVKFNNNIISNRKLDKGISNCLEQHRQELNQAVADSKNEAKQCIIKGKDEVIGIRNEIKKYTDSIENEMKNLLEVYKKCVKPLNPISSINCIRRNIKNINKSLAIIKQNSKRALKKISLRLQQITAETQECLQISMQNAEKRIQIVVNKILDCIANEIPVPTTEDPEITTATPEISTEDPGVTTQLPTDEPEISTEVPGSTTENPTDEPEVSTEAPEGPTEEPEIPSEGPTVTTEIPTAETGIPSETEEPQLLAKN